MADINLNLNQTARDTALVQTQIKVRTLMYFMALVIKKLYGLSDDEIDQMMKKIESQEQDDVFRFLASEAARGQLNSLFSEGPGPERTPGS